MDEPNDATTAISAPALKRVLFLMILVSASTCFLGIESSPVNLRAIPKRIEAATRLGNPGSRLLSA